MAIPLYHPELKETFDAANDAQAEVLEQSGWTRDVPRKYQEAETKPDNKSA
jgi:hypothetical protein